MKSYLWLLKSTGCSVWLILARDSGPWQLGTVVPGEVRSQDRPNAPLKPIFRLVISRITTGLISVLLCFIHGGTHYVFAAASLTTPDDWDLFVRDISELIEDELLELTDWIIRQILQ